MNSERKRCYLRHCRIFLEDGDFLETSAFGGRTHPVTGVYSMHSGMDGVLWNGKCSEAWITALADGRITECVTDVDGFSREHPAGNHVAIDHGNGLVSKYLHMEPGTVKVRNGDVVRRGDVLGYMGKTGMATGEHIHLQVERKGVPINPLGFLLTGSFSPLKWRAAELMLALRRLLNEHPHPQRR